MTYPQRSNNRGYPRDTPRIRLRSSAAGLACITVPSAYDHGERVWAHAHIDGLRLLLLLRVHLLLAAVLRLAPVLRLPAVRSLRLLGVVSALALGRATCDG
jgi:hypothetical protein